MTAVGDNVVVAHDRVDPKWIEHPTLFQPLLTPAEVTRARIDTGTNASDYGATEPGSSASDEMAVDEAPLRILITRRTQRDRVIAVQNMLSSMGHLTLQNFSGRIGAETIAAIRAFQKANDMPVTGAFSERLTKKVYEAAGKLEPPEGHLFVRQAFNRVFDAPVAFSNPDQTLGTHVFITTFDLGNPKAQWMALSVAGGAPASVVDRIEFPDDIGQRIAERLTPGSTLIIADTGINSAILPEGDDFLVLAKVKPAEVAWSKGSQPNNRPARLAKQDDAKPTTAKKTKAKQGNVTATNKVQRNARRYSYDRPRRKRLFWRW
jgi:peptidoglycan hydrolase-like protein with peptidoglycan-binding domain